MTNPQITPDKMAAAITQAADSGTLTQTPNGRKWARALADVPMSPATETEVIEKMAEE